MNQVEQARTLLAFRRRKLALYRPYPKQAEFHRAGSSSSERALLAANRSGKTWAAGMEVAMHLTGQYPSWWEGRRFAHPTKWWAASTTNEMTRTNPQRILLGEQGDLGTGAIPAPCIAKSTLSRGLTELIDTVLVKHVSGGMSRLTFKAYEQGREKWQGEELHGCWFDEEPPYDIYSEGLTRLSTTRGISLLTATPLLGMTEVVMLFFPVPSSLDRHLTQMTVDEAEHFSDADRESMFAKYKDHEREARLKGIPMLGSGRVFPVADKEISIAAFDIPKHWGLIGGLDFGVDHPTAAVKLAIDPDSKRIHVVQTYRVSDPEKTAANHAITLKEWGEDLPWAWPHDGKRRVDVSDGSSETMAAQYKRHGLRMLREWATFPDGGFGTEAANYELLELMQSDRFKVFSHLRDWFDEFHVYHRKDGELIRKGDDLMNATQKAYMMRRHARTSLPFRANMPPVIGMDYDPLSPGAPYPSQGLEQ